MTENLKNRMHLVLRLPVGAWMATLLISLITVVSAAAQTGPLSGKVVCIDPGHGGTAATDSYRQGPTGEREEWVNLRVGLYLRNLLEEQGAKVVMTRTTDEFVPLARRAAIAHENNADVFLSIHHNATADSSVNFPIIYFHGNASENLAGVSLGKSLADEFQALMYKKDVPVSIVSDYTIFASAGASVLRETYGIPAVLAEASFFTNPAEERRLKDTTYNRQEADAYLAALINYFNNPVPRIHEQYSIIEKLPPFQGLQEAERMSPEAKKWHEDFQKGQSLMESNSMSDWEQAYAYFSRSARSFPDSYVAGKCHEKRAILLNKLGRGEEAKQEATRAVEFYVN